MMGRLALGLLGGLGKGMMAAGGGKMALGLARTALGGLGSKGGGCAGGRKGSGKGRGGQHEDSSLEELLQTLFASRENRTRHAAPREEPLEAQIIDVQVEEPAPAMSAEAETALRCLAAHVTSFTDGRVRLRHPALCHAEDLEILRQQLLARPGLKEVTFNTATGSALLLYDVEQLDRLGLLAAALPLGVYLSRPALPAAGE